MTLAKPKGVTHRHSSVRHQSLRFSCFAMACLAIVSALESAQAQSQAQARTSSTDDTLSTTIIGFSLGVRQVAQRNNAVSPLRFTGAGLVGAVTLQGAVHRHLLLADIATGTLALRSPRVNSVAHLSYAEVDLSINRSITTRHVVRIDGGLAMAAQATLSKHDFGVPHVSPTRSRIASVSLGPRVGVERAARWGTVRGAVAVPALSLIDRPYGATKSAYAGFAPRLATVRDAQSLVSDASYTTTARARVGVQLGVRSRYFSHADGQAVRSLTNTYSAGFTYRTHRATQ